MDIQSLIGNILHPPVMFFFLGLFSAAIKSDLHIPKAIGQFLGIYLLFDIGIKGGEELFHSGFDGEVIKVLLVCISLSAIFPFLGHLYLKKVLDPYNAGAVAATYGSISAVTFATCISFLNSNQVPFAGYMVAGLALMESPAIISGLFIVSKTTKSDGEDELSPKKIGGFNRVLKEAFFNGSVLLLVGSMVIGYLGGSAGEKELAPFVTDIFQGMLSLYMLKMGISAGEHLRLFQKSGLRLTLFAIVFPVFGAIIGIAIGALIGLSAGNTLLMAIMAGSASYIAVPAAMELAVPKASLSIMLPMSLGITFTYNVTLGIPLYYWIITQVGIH